MTERLIVDRANCITAAGYAALQAEYHALFADERPRLVETVSWAAGNGDRSENGDYLYGKKRLREIDRRLGWLSKRMKATKVVDPAQQPDRSRVWFGATVTIADEGDAERVLTLVGDDETDTARRRDASGGTRRSPGLCGGARSATCAASSCPRANASMRWSPSPTRRGEGTRPSPRLFGRVKETHDGRKCPYRVRPGL